MKYLKRIIFLIFFAALAFSVAVYLWPSRVLVPLGEFIVVKDPEERCDVIVVLSGGVVDRSLAAADAYKKGLSQRILITRDKVSEDYYELKKRGVNFPEPRDLERLILESLGVPGASIATIDQFVDSTLEEAELVRGFLIKNRYKSAVLVTSSFHSRRARAVFRKVLQGTGIKVVSYPSRYSRFKPENWWQDRKAIQALVLEYQKMAAYLFTYGII